MKMPLKLLMAWCALVLLVGCGSPGAPRVPSLQLPRPPSDLVGARKGSQVTLTWTPPTQTTDGENIRAKYAGPTLVCRAVGRPVPASCMHSVGRLAPVVPSKPAKGEKKPPVPPQSVYVDVLPADLQEREPAAFAYYAVEAQNSRGRSAGLSDQVRVPLAPTLPPPSDVRTNVSAEGITLSYCLPVLPAGNPELQYAPRVYRQQKTSNAPAVIVHGEAVTVSGASGKCRSAGMMDRSFEWESTYSYWVTMVTSMIRDGKTVAEVEGDNSPPVTVFAHDIFPPAVPNGLEAVASGVGQKPFVDLTWLPDTEADLAGYNVFRLEPGRDWVQINTALVPTPAFRDDHVVSGRTYTYSVTAVDVRGNQSHRSQPAAEAVP